MSTAPPTEPFGAPAPPRGPEGRPRRHRARRKYWRPALVAATAVVSAVALFAAFNLEGSSSSAAGSNLGADSALASPTVNIPSAMHTTAPHKKKPKPKATKTTASSGSAGTLNDEAMPTGNLPGWKLTYSTDFPGNSLPSGWGAYTGEPGGNAHGYWLPQNVSVSDNELHLTTTPDSDPDLSGAETTGGVSFYGDSQTYGMYLVRMKGDYEPGLNISNIALLWPADNSWPPEIDFYEDNGGTRIGYDATIHSGSDNNVVHDNINSGPGTQWHTYGLIWTANSITYTVDGKAMASETTSDVDDWPDIPMILDLQSENLATLQPKGSIETMTVAWVAEYAQD
jgi:beta-glucanase (GH16 family)